MNKFLPWLAAVLLLSSCASTMLTNKSVPPAEITDLAQLESISMIHLIEKGNRMKPNDSLSQLSTRLLDSIAAGSANPRVHRALAVTDTVAKKRLQTDILLTLEAISKSGKLEQIRTTPLMDSIARSQNQRFTLCLVNAGFARKKGNYTNQIAKGIGIGILTMGLVTPVPVKATTSLYAMIYDAQNSSVVFYNNLLPVEKSPVDAQNLHQLYQRMYAGYFYTPK